MWYEASAATNVGLNRQENQDSKLVQEFRDLRGGPILCVAVADGMGGAANGRLAAESAIEAVEQGLSTLSIRGGIAPSEALCRTLVDIAHHSVKEALSEGEDGGTTLTIGLLQRDRVYIGHVGDSRAYLCRNGVLIQLTVDDHPEGAPSNVVSQAVGYSSSLSVATNTVRLDPDDALVICSDGLYKEVDEETLAGCLGNGDVPEDAARSMVERAVEAGARDNVTVAVVRVHGNVLPRWLTAQRGRVALLTGSLLLVLGLMSWIGISLTKNPRTASESVGRVSSPVSHARSGRIQKLNTDQQPAGIAASSQIALAPSSTLTVWTTDVGGDLPRVFSSRPIQVQLVNSRSAKPIRVDTEASSQPVDPTKRSPALTIERKGDKVLLTPTPAALQVYVSGALYIEGSPIVCYNLNRQWRISWYWDSAGRKPIRLYFAPLEGTGRKG